MLVMETRNRRVLTIIIRIALQRNHATSVTKDQFQELVVTLHEIRRQSYPLELLCLATNRKQTPAWNCPTRRAKLQAL